MILKFIELEKQLEALISKIDIKEDLEKVREQLLRECPVNCVSKKISRVMTLDIFLLILNFIHFLGYSRVYFGIVSLLKRGVESLSAFIYLYGSDPAYIVLETLLSGLYLYSCLISS